MKKKHLVGGTRKLTIRLGRDVIEDLEAEGREKAVTVTEVIRKVIEDYWARAAKLDALRNVMKQVDADVNRLRHELALATDVLLSFGGRLSREDAREWVNQNFGGQE